MLSGNYQGLWCDFYIERSTNLKLKGVYRWTILNKSIDISVTISEPMLRLFYGMFVKKTTIQLRQVTCETPADGGKEPDSLRGGITYFFCPSLDLILQHRMGNRQASSSSRLLDSPLAQWFGHVVSATEHSVWCASITQLQFQSELSWHQCKLRCGAMSSIQQNVQLRFQLYTSPTLLVSFTQRGKRRSSINWIATC